MVRRVLRDAGISTGATRQTKLKTYACRLADPTLGRAGGGIGQEPGCPRDRVCEASRARNVEMRRNGFTPKPPKQITPKLADWIVSLYGAVRWPSDLLNSSGCP